MVEVASSRSRREKFIEALKIAYIVLELSRAFHAALNVSTRTSGKLRTICRSASTDLPYSFPLFPDLGDVI